MAAADYRLCDHCDAKAFYDASLDYAPAKPGEYNRPAGCGDWAVLCEDCAQTYKCSVTLRITPGGAA